MYNVRQVGRTKYGRQSPDIKTGEPGTSNQSLMVMVYHNLAVYIQYIYCPFTAQSCFLFSVSAWESNQAAIRTCVLFKNAFQWRDTCES